MTLAAMNDDEWLGYVANGEAYAAEVFVAGVVGQLPFVQLFNPVGSGKRLRLRVWQPMALFALAINQNLRRHDVALATLGFFAGPENLLGGGPAPVAEGRSINQVVMIGSLFWLFLSTGNTRKDYPPEGLDWGHDLLPGQGIMTNGSVGGFVLAGFQWAELDL